ncbi:MAG: LamG domain-containing protein, partial [Verrucomicrobiales bacterium]
MKQNPIPTLRLLSITALSCAMLAPPSVHAIEGLLGYWRFDEGSGDVAIDGSGNGNDGEIISPDDAWVTDADRGSVYQSGNGSYVDMGDFRLPALDLDSDFTWSFWVFPNETDNNNIVFGNRWGPDGVDFAPREFIKFTPRVFEWHFDGAPQNTGGAETMFVVDEWSHNLVVKRGADFVYYRNGEELIAAEITAGPVNEQPLYIGGQNGNEVFSGLFDEVAIFGRALSVAEVTEVYTTGLSGESLAQAPVIEIDFNSDPEGTFEVFGSGSAEWRDSGGVDDSGYFAVTDALNGQRNTIIFDDPSDGLALRGFDFTIDLRVGGGTERPADGFSLNLVRPDDPLLQDPRGNGFSGTRDLGATEDDLPEEGSQTGLGIGLDAWVSGGSDVVGFSIRVDGDLVKQVEAGTLNGEADDETSLQTGPQNLDADPTEVDETVANLTWQQFRAFLDPDTSELTIEWKGK